MPSSQEIRRSIAEKWQENISKYGNLFSSENLSGTSPPSVFIGSYNYPQVFVGPLVPPIHGDTQILDSPEKWSGKSLEEIVNFRLSLVRGIQKLSIHTTEGRFIENLQELSMSSKPSDSEITFDKSPSSNISLDGESIPFGPSGIIKNAKFSGTSSVRTIEKVFYDNDLKAQDAVVQLYNSGIDISKIQKCFSIGMMGQHRKLVPTKWSITATDDIITKSLIEKIVEYPLIDSCRVFSFSHLGNYFSVILFPHRWIYEFTEAWFSGESLGFGSDSEDARGIDHPPETAGAYFAAKLGVLEYLEKNQIQSGVIIFREIRPEYSIPVGVWQVREGIRHAMSQVPIFADSLDDSINLAVAHLSISKVEWLSHGKIFDLLRQKTLSDFF